jgi:hypothetical protein
MRCAGSATRGEDNPVNIMRVLGQPPPIGVPDQHRARARLVRLQHERASAVGVVLDIGDLGIGVGRHLDRSVPLRPGLGHDPDGKQLFRQSRIRLDRPDLHDVVTLRLDGCNRRQVPAELGFRRQRPAEAEDDILGGQWRTVVKADALPQLELPSGRIDQAPGQGETGSDAVVRIEIDQRLVDLQVLRPGREMVERVRVEGQAGDRTRPTQQVLGAPRPRPRRNDSQGKHQDPDAQFRPLSATSATSA